MKKNILYLTIFIFIILIFKNYNIVLASTTDAVSIFLYKVFPYLFIMIIINDMLINSGFITLFKNPSLYIFVASLLSGTPSSAYITSTLYNKGIITKEYANNTLLFTYFCNPLFLYAMFNYLFNSPYQALKLMLIHYLSNFIIYIFNRKKITCTKLNIKTNFNISEAIKMSINTNLVVLGTIVFYMIISSIIINTFNMPLFLQIILKGILEVTQGLNSLANTSLYSKEILAIIFISFGGLSIHTQVKCILDEYNLDYRYFLKGRLYQVFLGLILVLIF